MDAQTFLVALKYGGFVVAAGSATWGLIAKTTFEDERKRKRLTPAGYLSVVMILGSGLISAVSYGLESVLKQQDASNQAAEAQRRRQHEETMALQREALRRAEVAELRAAATEQKTLALALAGQERERQLLLSRQIDEGTRANLARAEAVLSDTSRLLQPIEAPPVVRAVWYFETLKVTNAAWKERAAAQFEREKTDEDDENAKEVAREAARGARVSFEPFQLMTISASDPLYPGAKNGLSGLERLLSGFSARVSIWRTRPAMSSPTQSLGSGDYGFAMAKNPDSLLIGRGAAWIRFDVREQPKTVTKSGRIASVADLDGAYVLVEANPIIVESRTVDHDPVYDEQLAAISNLKLAAIEMNFRGRTYTVDRSELIRPFEKSSGSITYIAGPLVRRDDR